QRDHVRRAVERVERHVEPFVAEVTLLDRDVQRRIALAPGRPNSHFHQVGSGRPGRAHHADTQHDGKSNDNAHETQPKTTTSPVGVLPCLSMKPRLRSAGSSLETNKIASPFGVSLT